MLFGYPIAATQNNWLHDALCEAIRTIHAMADANKRYPAWPLILPKAHQQKLKSRWRLRNLVKAYDRAIRKLPKTDRDVVLQALESENRIADLLSGIHDCAKSDVLPVGIREAVKALFDFAFDLLSEFDDLRKAHYAAIYAALPAQVCPFCGTEPFDAPGAPREPLDHYLTKRLYPFAGANLRNLVPMGHRCNSSYKLASDLLRSAEGVRRVAFDPYNHAHIGVLLEDSEPFNGATENTPKWEIHFSPDAPAVATWDEVFSVRERYRRDVLDQSYSTWLWLFRHWVQRAGLTTDTDDALVAALHMYEEYWAASGLQDRAFLKAAVFRMLRLHCEAGHQRLLEQLRNLVAAPAPPAPLNSTVQPPSANAA